MKTKHIFWGLFFITLGVLILLYNLGTFYFDLSSVWKLWPIVLVIWGIAFIVKNNIVKMILAAVSAVVLAIAVFAFFSSAFCFVGNRFYINDDGISFDADSNADTTNYMEDFNSSIKSAEFDFKAGAGSFYINDSTKELLEATTTGIKNNYELNRIDTNDKSVVKLEMKHKRFSFHDGRIKNKAEIKLNTAPFWDLNFDIGAASGDFDLTSYKVQNVAFNMGAASLNVRLGDKSDETKFNLKAGASSIKIYVPESSGCEIKTDVALSSKEFNGFTKISSDLYRTDNFDSAKQKIYLNLKSGVSSIKVERYGKNW